MSSTTDPTSVTRSSSETPRRVAPTHDFTGKLRQPSLLPRVHDYVAWQRERRAALARGEAGPAMPDWAPLSINLDLTTACNYRCDHCIDWDILNSPIKYDYARLEQSMTEMAARGLRSVILIGGGEPTVYPGFESMVRHLKTLGLQVAVVTNGSRMERIHAVIDCFEKGDWIRLSLDSGSNETFETMHKPKQKITLDEICAAIRPMRADNPAPLVGFSYVIVWEGAEREEGVKVVENIDEIVMATKRARDAGFSFSLKPFLTRRPDGAEVMDPEAAKNLDATVARIRAAVDEAKTYETDDFKVVESINLRVLEQGDWREFTHQPRTCHMQLLRQVLTPLGLFNCPAHRGVDKAMIGPKDSWAGESELRDAVQSTEGILDRFDASHECREVTCLYHQVNWWIEDAIENGTELDAGVERYDAFL